MRAAAQVGVLLAMEEYNLTPDVVVGTSGGAIVAALYAAGLSPGDLATLFKEYSKAKGKVVDFNWPGAVLALLTWDFKKLAGAVRGRSIEQIIDQSLPVKRFQDLTKCQLLIPAVNLNNGQPTVFCDYKALGLIPDQSGEYEGYQLRDDLSIAQAVRASISIPGVFVPAAFPAEEDCYVDGGLRDGYPLNIAVRLGRTQRVLGVNLGYAGMRRDSIVTQGPLEILNQSLDIMIWAQFKDRLQDRALVNSRLITINPLIYNIGTFELEYIPQMILRGYDVAVRLFNERGLKVKSSGNRELLFRNVRVPISFPEKDSPYFNYLLENQIPKNVPKQAEQPGRLRQLRTLVRKGALG